MEKAKAQIKSRIPDKHKSSLGMQTLLVPPSLALLQTPLLTTALDICAKCGVMYCVAANVEMVMISPILNKGGRSGSL